MSTPLAQAPELAGLFAVRFSRPWWQAGLSDNTLRLRGSGTLQCTPDRICLCGAGGVRHELPAAQVFNVVRVDCSVSFAVLAGDGMVDRVRCWLADAAAAEALRLALPGQVTGSAAQALQDHHNFQRALELAGPPARWTPRLIAVNGVVFGLAALTGAGVFEADPGVLVAWGTNFGPLTRGGQWWRLLTSMFLHFGLLHLAFNMWALAGGGALAERLFGARRFLLVYFVAGLAGSLASVLWNPLVNSAGASGAIFGVFGALWAYFLHGDARLPASLVRQQRTSGALFIAINLIFGFTQGGIDNSAHLGGLLTGLLLGWGLARR